MLQKIRIKGYRALKEFELELPEGRPLVLIGENATGKSSILDAISMICAVADGNAGRAIHDRKGWQAVTWAGTAAEIEFVVRFSGRSPTFGREGAPTEYMVRFSASRSVPTVVDEEVRIYKNGPDAKPFVALKGGMDGWVANVQTKERDALTARGDNAIITNALLAAVMDESKYPTPLHVKEALGAMAFYPSFTLGGVPGKGDLMGARQVEAVPRIDSTGSDLLNALHTLSQESPSQWQSVLTDLRAVFPWCESVKFPPASGRGLITLKWVDARSGATLYLDDMSEGMRVYLALLAALHAPDTPSLIAFDEPERSLHPRALRRIVKLMESKAEHVPIVVATHSDRLLDHLEDPASALRITRFSTEIGVRAEKLDPELLDAWLRDYTMSELRAREMLEAPADENDEGLS